MRKNLVILKFCLAFATMLVMASCDKKESVELETTTVSLGDICESVTATGTLESVSQVDVGTQVTGIVSKLYADYNSEVKAGQLLAEIDKTTLESELKSANASLTSAKLEYDYAKKNYVINSCTTNNSLAIMSSKPRRKHLWLHSKPTKSAKLTVFVQLET